MNNFDDIAKNTLDEWINFLKTEDVNAGTKAKGLIAAKEGIDMLKLNKEDMLDYERDEDAWRDYASSMSTHFKSGEIKGIAIGEANKQQFAEEKVKQEKLDIAKNCLHDGMSIVKIANLTGLSEDEIWNISK